MTLCRDLGFLAVAGSFLFLGCTPDIGADCSTSLNCSQMGDRTCDTSLPGGYCTIPNCEPDTCPSEAACIAFRQQISINPACQDSSDTRMIRTFCMVHCSENDDCRGGYVCADMNAVNNPWGASLVDRNNRDGRVCIVPASQNSSSATGIAGYCQWSGEDTGTGLPEPYDAGMSQPEPEDASAPDAP